MFNYMHAGHLQNPSFTAIRDLYQFEMHGLFGSSVKGLYQSIRAIIQYQLSGEERLAEYNGLKLMVFIHMIH